LSDPSPCYLIIGLIVPPVILVYLIVACLFSLPVFAVLGSFVVNGMVMLCVVLCLPRHVFGFSFETWISFVWFV